MYPDSSRISPNSIKSSELYRRAPSITKCDDISHCTSIAHSRLNVSFATRFQEKGLRRWCGARPLGQAGESSIPQEGAPSNPCPRGRRRTDGLVWIYLALFDHSNHMVGETKVRAGNLVLRHMA